MRPLNILQLAALPFPSHQGSQVYIRGMASGLAAAGHRVWLATYGHGEGTPAEGVHRVAVPTPPGRRSLRSGPTPGKPVLDALLAARVARLLRRHPIDLIHAHHVEAPVVARVAMALARRRVPLLYNLHTALGEELPVYLPSAMQALAGRLGDAVDRGLADHVDGAVALSETAAARLTSWGYDPVLRVPPGIDPDEVKGGDAEAARRRWSLGEGPWVLYTGNTDPYQDLPDLFEAVARMSTGGLLVVTGSPLAPLRELAARVGLPAERLRLVSSQDFADTRDALAAATVGALPRTVCAGFPIKLLNLLAAGLPVVAAQGAAQPLEGVIPVPDHQPVALAGALASVLAEPDMAARLGEGGARAVRSRYAWPVVTRRLVDGYRSVLPEV